MGQGSNDSYTAPPGSVLLDARLSAGKSVEEVAEALNLLKTHVEALESNDYSRFNSPMFARGYIRSYARYFGLDEAPLLNDCERICRRDEEQAAKKRPQGQTRAPGQAKLLFALLGTLLIWGLSVLLFNGQKQPEIQLSLIEERYAPLVELRARPSLGESLLQLPDSGTAPRVPPELLHDVSMTLLADETVWVEVRDANNAMQFSGNIDAGQKQELDLQGPVQIAIAYWPALEITYNQQAVDLNGLAESNAVRVQIGEL
ncbi:helix-turn-helix domain-containing protein [Spongiibacter marinus]|uniref:helix-turn-helix domain-containing protein n=1 Tax=Spongiibacter marinus TaxID=354246 RepID=UPI0035681506